MVHVECCPGPAEWYSCKCKWKPDRRTQYDDNLSTYGRQPQWIRQYRTDYHHNSRRLSGSPLRSALEERDQLVGRLERAAPQMRRNNLAQRNLTVASLTRRSARFPFVVGHPATKDPRLTLVIETGSLARAGAVWLVLADASAAFPAARQAKAFGKGVPKPVRAAGASRGRSISRRTLARSTSKPGSGASWAGPGPGVHGAQLHKKAEVIDLGLKRHRDVLAPTLPGHAGGPPPEGALNDDLLADAGGHAMDEAGLATARVAGHSPGGPIVAAASEKSGGLSASDT